jgi:hypothetical protein
MTDMPFEVTAVVQGGVTYRVEIWQDEDSMPGDYGTYSQAALDAFTAGEWEYVRIVVMPELGCLDTGSLASTQGRTEYGKMPGRKTAVDLHRLTESHPVPQMIREVQENMQAMRDALAGVYLP